MCRGEEGVCMCRVKLEREVQGYLCVYVTAHVQCMWDVGLVWVWVWVWVWGVCVVCVGAFTHQNPRA